MITTFTFDTLLGIVSLIATFLLYFFDLRQKLDYIIAHQEGILTKQQAHDLIDLYLDAVNLHIELAVKRYVENDLANHYAQGNIDAIKNEFERAYEQIVRKSIRKMVSSFRLRGNHQVDDLISSVNQNNIGQSLNEIVSFFADAYKNGVNLNEVIPRVLSLSRETSNTGKQLIMGKIDKLYPASAK